MIRSFDVVYLFGVAFACWTTRGPHEWNGVYEQSFIHVPMGKETGFRRVPRFPLEDKQLVSGAGTRSRL